MKFLVVLIAFWGQFLCLSDPAVGPSGSFSHLTPYTLDISRPAASDKVKSIQCELDGIPSVIYVPKFGVDVNKVTDRRMNLWVSDTTQGMILATLHTNRSDTLNTGYFLFRVIARDVHGEVITNLYRYHNGSYSVVSDKIFDNELRGMRLKINNHDNFTLDIDDVSPGTKALYEEVVFDGVFSSVHIPRKGFHATSVVESNLPIWTGGADERCTNALIYYRGLAPAFAQLSIIGKQDFDVIKFFKKKGNKWTLVTEDIFYSKFSKEFLFSADEHATPKDAKHNAIYILNLADPSRKDFSITKHMDAGDVIHKSYYLNKGSIFSIIDGSSLLWQAEGNEKCVFLSSYSLGETVALYAHIEVGEEYRFKYFEKVDGIWAELHEDEYNTILHEFGVQNAHSEVPENGNVSVIFDISDVDEFLFDTTKHINEPNAILEYSSIPGISISHVFDGDKTLWIANKEEVECTRVILDNVEGVTTAVYLTVINADRSAIHKIYGLKNDEWAVLDTIKLVEPEEEIVNASNYSSHHDELASLFGDDDEEVIQEVDYLPTETKPVLHDWLNNLDVANGSQDSVEHKDKPLSHDFTDHLLEGVPVKPEESAVKPLAHDWTDHLLDKDHAKAGFEEWSEYEVDDPRWAGGSLAVDSDIDETSQDGHSVATKDDAPYEEKVDSFEEWSEYEVDDPRWTGGSLAVDSDSHDLPHARPDEHIVFEDEYTFDNDLYDYDYRYDSELFGEEIELGKPAVPHPVCLDISELQHSKAEIIDARIVGRPFILYNPLRNSPITCVVEGNSKIWKAKFEEDVCLFASAYVEGYNLRCLEISVRGKSSIDRHYYLKVAGEWNEIDAEEFEKRVEGRRDPPSDSFLTGGYMTVLALAAFIFFY